MQQTERESRGMAFANDMIERHEQMFPGLHR